MTARLCYWLIAGTLIGILIGVWMLVLMEICK